MIGYTTLSSSFDSDGERQFQLQIWITESQTSNKLGIEFSWQYVSKLRSKSAVIELKNTANAICYGNLCCTKHYPFVSKIHTIRTPHQIQIDAKTSRVWKHLSQDKSQSFPPGTTFVFLRHSVKSGLDFVNVLRTQPEAYLPILLEKKQKSQNQSEERSHCIFIIRYLRLRETQISDRRLCQNGKFNPYGEQPVQRMLRLLFYYSIWTWYTRWNIDTEKKRRSNFSG